MKILFVQTRGFINGAGGTEKVCATLANHFSENGHQVTIATNENITGGSFFPLRSPVAVANIYNTEARYLRRFEHDKKDFARTAWGRFKYKSLKAAASFLNRARHGLDYKNRLWLHNMRLDAGLWKRFIAEQQPDLIITMSLRSLLEISFGQTLDIPIINSTNGRPDYDYTDLLWHHLKIEREALRECHGKLAGIQILFESYKPYVSRNFNGIIRVIPNSAPEVAEAGMARHDEDRRRRKLVTLSTLKFDHKQQDMAVRVFARVAEKHKHWELHFWGDGPDREILGGQIAKAGLSGRVFLRGLTTRPLDELRDSDIFIFPSKFEGFPLALIEAMSAGLPCLGLASCSGVNELLRNGTNGFLAGDESEMAAQLDDLMGSRELRARLGRQAHQDVMVFNESRVLGLWDAFISEIRKQPGR